MLKKPFLTFAVLAAIVVAAWASRQSTAFVGFHIEPGVDVESISVTACDKLVIPNVLEDDRSTAKFKFRCEGVMAATARLSNGKTLVSDTVYLTGGMRTLAACFRIDGETVELADSAMDTKYGRYTENASVVGTDQDVGRRPGQEQK